MADFQKHKTSPNPQKPYAYLARVTLRSIIIEFNRWKFAYKAGKLSRFPHKQCPYSFVGIRARQILMFGVLPGSLFYGLGRLILHLFGY